MDTFDDEDADPIVRLLREAAQRAEDDDPLPAFDPAWFEAMSHADSRAIVCPWFRPSSRRRCHPHAGS
jgi:hypothetical protein